MTRNSTLVLTACLLSIGGSLSLAAYQPAEAQTTAAGDAAPQASGMSLQQTVVDWPEHARMAAMDQMQKYGAPAEITATMALWRGNGPWVWTRVDTMETPHAFPGQHPDLMEQAVYYRVPADKVDDLNAYDGSVTIYRTQGYMTARCDKEGANFLALNLAHDIITDRKTVAEARAYYAAAIAASMEGRMDPYMMELKFQPQGPNAADPDQAAAT